MSAEDGTTNVRRFLRAAFSPSRAEIVKRFGPANRQTPVRLFVAVFVALSFYLVSTLPPFLIIAWLIGLLTALVGAHLLRAMIIRRPSRWDAPLSAGIRGFLCMAWGALPLALEFRGPAERIMGVVALAAILTSAMTAVVEAQVWLINLVLVGGALLAPEIVSLLHGRPQDSVLGVLFIKLLFLMNIASLGRYWSASAKREATMQAELAAQRKKAEDLAEAKAMFLAHMSHEIRSPLAGVTLLASVLKRLEGVPEDQRQMIEQIDAGGQAILNLLNAVLDYSKIEAGKITLQIQPTDVRALLGSVTSFFQLEAREAKTGLSLAMDGVPAIPLLVDGTRLRQIVTNLVSNAVKHSPSATVQLNSVYDDGDLLIEVVDTGRGVDEEVQGHLFFPREQRTGENSGAGLGLAISRGLVSLMAGEIGFRDTPRRRSDLLVPDSGLSRGRGIGLKSPPELSRSFP